MMAAWCRCGLRSVPGVLSTGIPAIAAAMILASCVPSRPPAGGAASAHALGVSTLQKVNAEAHVCWLPHADFQAYGIVPELDTTGTPRLLLTPRGKPQSLPSLVIAASGRNVQVFGPLAGSPLGPRINSDVARWASGSTGC